MQGQWSYCVGIKAKGGSEVAKFNKGETGWMSGNQVVYTGESEVLHGGTFHIANVLNADGTLGKTVWIADRDEVAERASMAPGWRLSGITWVRN